MKNENQINGHKQYLLASDFDQTLSLNDSGIVLSELLGRPGFQEKVARELFESHGTALQDWDKVRTDRLTFHEEPSRPVLHESVSGN